MFFSDGRRKETVGQKNVEKKNEGNRKVKKEKSYRRSHYFILSLFYRYANSIIIWILALYIVQSKLNLIFWRIVHRLLDRNYINRFGVQTERIVIKAGVF